MSELLPKARSIRRGGIAKVMSSFKQVHLGTTHPPKLYPKQTSDHFALPLALSPTITLQKVQLLPRHGQGWDPAKLFTSEKTKRGHASAAALGVQDRGRWWGSGGTMGKTCLVQWYLGQKSMGLCLDGNLTGPWITCSYVLPPFISLFCFQAYPLKGISCLSSRGIKSTVNCAHIDFPFGEVYWVKCSAQLRFPVSLCILFDTLPTFRQISQRWNYSVMITGSGSCIYLFFLVM